MLIPFLTCGAVTGRIFSLFEEANVIWKFKHNLLVLVFGFLTVVVVSLLLTTWCNLYPSWPDCDRKMRTTFGGYMILFIGSSIVLVFRRLMQR